MACLGMAPGVASAESSSPGRGSGTSSSSFASPLVVPGVQPLVGGQQAQAAQQAKLANPEAVSAREESRTKFEGLNVKQAEKLAGEAFPEAIDRPAGTLPPLPAGQRIVGYPADDAAQVDLPGGKHGVIESMEPIAIETSPGHREPLDLGLDEVGGVFQPARSGVGLRIPKRLADGVQLPGTGVSLTPVDGSGVALGGSEGVVDGATVLYANTETDADTVVKPLPTGFEEDTLLRSANSPSRLSFRVGLPAGARLVQGAHGSGGVQVVKEGAVIASVLPPSAVDAAGTAVAVSMRTSGDMLTLSVDDATMEYEYPIEVDPKVVVDKDLHRTGDQGNWAFATNTTGFYAVETGESLGIADHGTKFEQGAAGYLEYKTQGESQIYNFRADVYGGETGYGTNASYMAIAKSSYEAGPTEIPTGPCCERKWREVAASGSNGNSALFMVTATGAGHGLEAEYSFEHLMYGVEVAIAQEKEPSAVLDTTDQTVEGIEGIGSGPNALYPGVWASYKVSPQIRIGVKAFDPGIGVKAFSLTSPNKSGWGVVGSLAQDGCNGVQCTECFDLGEVCAREAPASKPFVLDLSELDKGGELPEGEDTVEASVEDGAGLKSTVSTAKIKIDNAPPDNLTLSGLPSTHEISDGQHFPLKASATSGDAGMASIRLTMDGQEVGTPSKGCSPGPCTANGEWTLSGESYAVAGQYTLAVIATDNAGNVTTEDFQVTVHHASGVAVGPGSVNPVTGELGLSATDVSIGAPDGGLTVSRAYRSRHLTQGAEGPFGPQWALSLGAPQSLSRTFGGGMVLTSSNDGQVVFVSNGKGGYTSPAGDAALTLTEKTVGGKAEFLLSDNGTVTTFALPSGSSGSVYTPSISEGADGTNATTYSYRLENGVIEPTEELAPVPAGVSCAPTLTKGCRALSFAYATETTATGEAPSEWKAYKGRLEKVSFTAYSPAAKAMETKVVAEYAYDKQGRLRAEWNPQISPALKTSYGYDEEGHVTAMTPAGQQPRTFEYGTISGDPNAGRLLKVTLAQPKAGASEEEVKKTLGEEKEAPKNTEAPKLSGSTVVGVRMSVSDGVWSNAPVAYAYEWEDCNSSGKECTPILGATNENYTPASSDVGHTLIAQVSAIDGDGSVSASSAASTVVLSTAGGFMQAVDGGNSLNAVSCISGTTDCVLSDSAGKALYATNVSSSAAASWSTWNGPSGESPSQAIDCVSTTACVLADGKSLGGNLYYASSLGGSWSEAYSPVFGVDAISCASGSSVMCVAAQDGGGIFHYSTSPASTSWTAEEQASGIVKGAFCLSSSFCAMADSRGYVRVATSTTQIESSSWKETDVDGTTALNGIACATTSKCAAVDGAGNALTLTIESSGAASVSKHDIDGTNNLIAVTCTGSSTCVAVDSVGSVFVSTNGGESWTKQYSLGDDLTSVSCASSSLCATVDTTGNVTAFNPAGGTVASEAESDAPQPGSTIEYDVPLSGPELQTMTKAEVEKWGQTDDPVEATAIFPPDEPMGWPAKKYTRATVTYLDSKDRVVNTSSPTSAISTTEYNANNDVVRTLSPDNRAAALKETCESSEKCKSAEVSKGLDSESTYNETGSEPGTELLSTLGPKHTIELASGTQAEAREHTVYSYNEGAPSEGGPYHLVTKMTEGAVIAGKEESEVRTTTTSYSGQINLGWKLRKPSTVTTDPSNMKLIHSAFYEPKTGNVTETRLPEAGAPTEEQGNSFALQFGKAGSESGEFKEPQDVAVNSSGDEFILDTGNDRVEEYNAKGVRVKTFAEEELKEPRGITLDSKGDVWVANTGDNDVVEFNSSGGHTETLHKGLEKPEAVTFNSEGELWVVETGDDEAIEYRYLGGETWEESRAIGAKGTGEDDFMEPQGIAIGAEGNVYVSDTGNDRIDEYSAEGKHIRNFGKEGTGNGQLKGPTGIATDSAGDVWVADTGNNRIQEFSASGTFLSTFGKEGTTEGKLKTPKGVAIDSEGNAWVADTANSNVQEWIPGGAYGLGTHTAHDTQTIYYSAGANEAYKACGEHPEWANLPCQVQPGGQPAGNLPKLAVTTYTYNMWDEPETTTNTVEVTKTESKTRTMTRTYDAAGRLKTTAISSTVGIALPTVTDEYNGETGALEKQSTTAEGKTKTITSLYNTLGELTSYTDAAEKTTTYEYDVDGRLKKTNDGKGTETYTYSKTTGLPVELLNEYGTTKLLFTGTYDVEGNMLTEGYPNGMTATYTYNQVGTPTSLVYKKTTDCTEEKEKCIWFKDAVLPSIHGQWLEQTSTFAHQAYTYDAAGRLKQVQNTPTGGKCTTREYYYNEDSSRTLLRTYEPNSKGECATETGTEENHSYDAADRLDAEGVKYNEFGDITALPAADAGGSELTSTYYTDNQLASQTQNGQTIGYSLDPAGRMLETVATGKKVANTTLHYAGPGASSAWSENASGETSRNIPGLGGGLAAIQNNAEAPVLQLANLHGDIVATAYLSETATELASKISEPTEFGVPTTSAPPKYSWLGALELPTELPSGVIAMGARSYVTELGAFLQPDPIPGGSANAYSYTFGDPVNTFDPSGESTISELVYGFAAQVGAEYKAKEEAERRAAEEAAARAAAEKAAQEAYWNSLAVGPQYGGGEAERGGEEGEQEPLGGYSGWACEYAKETGQEAEGCGGGVRGNPDLNAIAASMYGPHSGSSHGKCHGNSAFCEWTTGSQGPPARADVEHSIEEQYGDGNGGAHEGNQDDGDGDGQPPRVHGD
jgi:RHS repeat-associated protein